MAKESSLDDVLRERIRRRALLRAEKVERPLRPTESRSGGTPHLEEGEAWPVCGDPLETELVVQTC